MSEGLQIKMYAQHLHHWAVLYKLYNSTDVSLDMGLLVRRIHSGSDGILHGIW